MINFAKIISQISALELKDFLVEIILFCFFIVLVVFGYFLKKLRPKNFNRTNRFFGVRLQPEGWVFKRLAIFFVTFIAILLLYVVTNGFSF